MVTNESSLVHKRDLFAQPQKQAGVESRTDRRRRGSDMKRTNNAHSLFFKSHSSVGDKDDLTKT